MSETNGHAPADAVDPSFVWSESDIEPRVFPVRIAGKDYVLKSATTGAAIKYRNACSKAARWDATPQQMKVIGFENLADSEPLLVQLCTFEVRRAGGQVSHGPVSMGWVLALPPEVTQKLFDKIVEISPNLKGDSTGRSGDGGGGSGSAGAEESLPKDLPASTTGSS